jgi:hypothetical protein
MRILFTTTAILATCFTAIVEGQEKKTATLDTSRGDAMIAEYFQQETERLTANSLSDIKTLADWQKKKAGYRVPVCTSREICMCRRRRRAKCPPSFTFADTPV